MNKLKYFFIKKLGLTSLKTQLMLVLLLITILPIIILGSLSYKKSYEKLTEQSHEHIELLTEQVNVGLDEYFSNIVNTVNIISQQPGLITIVEAEESEGFWNVANNNSNALIVDNKVKDKCIRLTRSLIDSIKDNNIVKTCYIGTRNHNMYSSKSQYIMGIDGDFDCTQREWYKSAVKNRGKIIWTNPYLDRKKDITVVTIAKAIEKKGEIYGVIAIDINLKSLINRINSIEINDSGHIFVTNTNGKYIIHKDEEKINKQLENKDFLNILNNNETNNYKSSGLFYSFITNKTTGWKIVSVFDTNELYAKTNSTKEYTASIILSVILIIILLIFLISYNFSAPITEIIDHLKIITSGNFNNSIPKKLLRRKDEIGILASSVQKMQNNVGNLVENMKSLNEEIYDNQKEIAYKLGEIVETRSKETGHHVKRVAEYSYVIGKEYGLSDKNAEILKLASTLHDIGKIGISDEILLKPGRLSEYEFDIIKTHTQIGYDMLKNSTRELFESASIIALQHHEKYDGSGYPEGLKGEDIHIYARIVALADVFDALSTKRVYKDAWELEKILVTIKEERGKHFDPKLVDIFIANLDKIVEIRNDLSNNQPELQIV